MRLHYFRFALSFRDLEEMFGMRGVTLSYGTVREWRLKFGRTCAKRATPQIPVGGSHEGI